MSRPSDLRVLLRLRGTARHHDLDDRRRRTRQSSQPLDLRTVRAGWQLTLHAHR